MMTKENRKLICEAVRGAGDHLKDRLPEHPGLAKRNSYAHLWERIKHHMGKSYKDCSDEQVEEILGLVRYYKDNPC